MSGRRARRQRAALVPGPEGKMLVVNPAGDVDMAHNYQHELARLWQAGRLPVVRGAAGILNVAHDDDCCIWRGGRCNCRPELEMRWLPAEGVR